MPGKYVGIDWHARARDLKPRGEAYIKGQRVSAMSGATFPCLSPIDGRTLAAVAAADGPDIDALQVDVPPGVFNVVPRFGHTAGNALRRAGVVYFNCYDADDITVPFGGFKQSGTGRDKSLYAFDRYTELTITGIDLA